MNKEELQQKIEAMRPNVEHYFSLLEKYMKVTDGWLPRWDFEHLPHFVGQAAIEFGLLRKSENGTEIFLIQRPEDDPYWPNEWHLPGTVLWPTDTKASMWNRLIKNELNGLSVEPQFVDHFWSTREERERGACLHALHMAWTEATEVPGGSFFPINELPKPMIEHHLKLIDSLRNK